MSDRSGQPSRPTAAELDAVFRRHAGQLYATFVGFLGDFDLAEDDLQDATVAALQRWPSHGLPDDPGAWLLTVGRRKALDRIRREAKRNAKHQAALDRAASRPEEAPLDRR